MDPIDDLDRSLRHAAREAAEDVEADVREADLLTRSLSDAAFELGEDAAQVTISAAGRSISGIVVHAGVDILTTADGGGGSTHVRLGAIASIRVDDRGRGRTTPRSKDPRTFRAMLAHSQATGTLVELSGSELAPVAGSLVAVAEDHVVLDAKGRRHLVPMSAIAVASIRSRG